MLVFALQRLQAPPRAASIAPQLALVGLEAIAAVYLVATRPKGPPIQLSTTSNSGGPLLIERDEESEPDKFYPKLRARKLATLAANGIVLAVTLFRLGWELSVVDDFAWRRAVERAAEIVFWSFTSTLALLSFPLSNSYTSIDRHWAYTVTLTALTGTSLAVTLLRILLPQSTHLSLLPSTLLPKYLYVPSLILLIISTVFQLVAFALAGTTPRCAPLVHSKTRKPVSLITSCSPLSFLFFGWLSPVLASGLVAAQKEESLDEKYLPILSANDRAVNLWERIKGSAKLMDQAPRGVNRLLWRVLIVNKRLFIIQTALACVNSVLYYLPAFFLQRIVHFLELREQVKIPEDPDTEYTTRAWGYLFCAGLLASSAIEALVAGQLWFVSNSMLSGRIRVQLNTLVFDKTLKRKDVSGVSNASDKSSEVEGNDTSSSDGSKAGEEDDEDPERGFGSKTSILALFSIDVDRVAEFAVWCFTLIDAPSELVIGTIFLYSLLGYASLIGISIAVLFLPLNHWTSKGFATTQDKLMSTRDRRVGLMQEVLSSIRMLKYMAIEKPFEEKILKARDAELAQLRWNFILEVSFQAIWSISPILCILVSFWAYTSPLLMGKTLTPSVAFASLAVWNELRFALNIIPEVLVNALQCLVSLRRIEKYLGEPEVETPTSTDGLDTVLTETPVIEQVDVSFKDATVTWPRNEAGDSTVPEGQVGASNGNGTTSRPASVLAPKSFELQDINIEFPTGELSLICGRLGSGKTLMLLALLGEVDVVSGSVTCPRSSPGAIALPSLEWDKYLNESNWIAVNQTAFVPQQAWLQNATVKDNILFGLPCREERYQAVLKACSLVSDLNILEDGDATEIGEKGINLSGGQKARISLARAVYSRASTLLFDDILSAVDAHTAAHIYENCLKGPLLKGRTVILVSHQVQLTAPGAAYIVSLENGRTAFVGSASEFLKSENLNTIADPDDKDKDEPTSKSKPVATDKSTPKKVNENAPPRNKSLSALIDAATPVSSTDVSSASEAESETDDDEDDIAREGKIEGDEATQPPKIKKARKLIEDEGRAVGRVSGAVWKLYMGCMGGGLFWFTFALIFGGAKVSEVAQTYWLGQWARNSGGTEGPHSVTYYLVIYAALSIAAVVVEVFQWFILYMGTLRSSVRLHKMLLHSILRAPLRFFDTQALGRIQNRFAKDLEGIDSNLPDNFGRTLIYGLGVLTTLAVVTAAAPAFLIGFVLLSVLYYRDARLFSTSAREFRRLDSISKSPLFSIYGEAISGVAVIRSFGASSRFLSLMLEKASNNITYYSYLWGTNRWLSVRFTLLSAVVVALTAYVLIQADGKIDAAAAGFCLTFALNISNDLLFLVRRYTQLELSLVAVERIREYSLIEQEAPEIIEPRPPAHWPQGEIVVKNLHIRYAPELPDVLHDLSFTIKKGERIGLVGATGCGKSTLASSFFRFVEASSGSIHIDGLDISKIGLLDLRSRLTIVPQDPVIMSGTLRSTLDIFGEHEDSEIFEALRRVHLIKESERPDDQEAGANRSVFWNLDAEVAEGGSNFSTGQRQLVCMARALLRSSRILLLDEATASTDLETDELITQTIRSEFSDSTLLVIAHRLRTIVDFDKVMVLDKGRLLEFDSPAALIKDPNSQFHSLCRAGGKNEFKVLEKMALGKARVTHKPRKLVRRSTSKTSKPSLD
ncbi:uncharacterized protein JCM15063_005316 [Sporobolomyces koalae]|uniref:uncharacterized protein n=1 Tax=Sporobolomyces koalae TaxID=500713 RepID=UPI0031709049